MMNQEVTRDIQYRAYRLFLSALEQPKGERDNFLATKVTIDAEVVAAATRMLQAFEADDSPGPGTAIIPQEWAQNRQDSLVGEWRITEHLGSGGFGQVYRAWRPTPTGIEEGAIKFLDMAPTAITMFIQERNVLADL